MGKSRKHDKRSSKEKHKHKTDKSKKKSKKAKKEIKHRTLKEKHSETEGHKRQKEAKVDFAFAIPVELMNSKSHAPETPQEYERRQSEIRRMTDPLTGRTRIIKGDGEVLEEIVSRSRHTEINKKATQEDGRFFEATTLGITAKQNR